MSGKTLHRIETVELAFYSGRASATEDDESSVLDRLAEYGCILETTTYICRCLPGNDGRKAWVHIWKASRPAK